MKSYKYRLKLNDKEKTLASKHAGTSRHAYNWAVAYCYTKIEEKKKVPSGFDLCTIHRKEVKLNNKWYYDTAASTIQSSISSVYLAWSKYFMRLKKGSIQIQQAEYVNKCKKKGSKVNTKKLYSIGKPKFKKKGSNDSFYLVGTNLCIKNNRIKLPKFGWVRIQQKVEDVLKIKSATISRTADHWYVSFNQELGNTTLTDINKKPKIGVDLGIKALATLSNGRSFDNVKAFEKYSRKLAKAQRVASRRLVKGAKAQSSNYKKAQIKVAKLHYKISCLRKFNLHQITSYLAKNHSLIAIEDLVIKDMFKNKNLSSAIADVGFYEFRRQLEYKTRWYGSKLFIVNKWFPSSKKCSKCGNVKKVLSIKTRVYSCSKCKVSLDRDENAAINILEYAVKYTV